MSDLNLWQSLDREMPGSLSREGPIYQALIGSASAIPNPVILSPDDFRSGAVMNELQYASRYLQILFSGLISDKTADLLDSIVSAFTGLGRFTGEGDSAYLARFMAIVQQHSNTWGTPVALLGSLATLLNANQLYLQEDPNWIDPVANPNLVLNGDFESGATDWTFTGTASISSSTSFSGTSSLSLNLNDTAYQAFSIGTAGDYRLTFAMNVPSLSTGPIVYIKNTTSGLWYDGHGNWVASSTPITVTSKTVGWNVAHIDIIGMPIDSFTLTFVGGGVNYIDLVELAVQQKYPGYKLYIVSGGQNAETSLTMTNSVPDDSTIPMPPALLQGGRYLAPNDAEVLTYFDVWSSMTFIGGDLIGLAGSSYLTQVFEILRPGGVRAQLILLESA